MPHPEKHLSFKLAWAYTVVFCSLFLFTHCWTTRTLEKNALRDLSGQLQQKANWILSELPENILEKKSPEDLARWAAGTAKKYQAPITLTDQEGNVLADSRQTINVSSKINIRHLEEIRTALSGKTGFATNPHQEFLRTPHMLYVATPISPDHNSVVGVLRLSAEDETLQNLLGKIRIPFLSGLALGMFGIFILNQILRQSLKKRVALFSQATKHFVKQDSKPSPIPSRDDEFDPLVRTLNQTGMFLEARIRDIENEKNKLSVILETMKDGVIALGKNREVLWLNASARTIFQSQDLLSRQKSLIEITRNTELDELATLALENSQIQTREMEMTYPQTTSLHVHAIPIEKHSDAIREILVLHDVTQIRKLENLRKEFVANVSHEIRTPLTSILGFIETLLGGAMEDPEARQSFLKIMHEDAERLSRLIQDLLEISRLESGEIKLNKRAFLLRELSDQVLRSLSTQLQQRKIQLVLKIPPDLQLFADSDKIKQVLINLIDNAIKFSKPEGGLISVVAFKENRELVCQVHDTGVGIPEEAVARVFERFFRVDKARSRESGGTGLGLSIVKHIIEAHDGTVACQSQVDHGSTFSFKLPLS